jgi:hypothetical protein
MDLIVWLTIASAVTVGVWLGNAIPPNLIGSLIRKVKGK